MSITSVMEPLARIRSKQMIELLNTGKRIDGRDLAAYRSIKVEPGFVQKAEGSAQVTLGNSRVLVGIKVAIGEPYADTPDQAVQTVNAEFVPLAHQYFEPGPPDENSIELARVVDRGIRESKAIDLEKLVLVRGREVYIIFIDVYILNHDGNLIDASAFAALVALMNTKIPKYVVNADGEAVRTDEKIPLPLRDYPIPISIVKMNGKLLVDPNLEEERAANAKITIATTQNGDICALQKSGTGAFTAEEIMTAKQIAIEKAKEIRKILSESAMNGQN